MLDLTNSIYTQIKTAVLALYPSAKVDKKYQSIAPSFPYVTVIDVDDPEISHDLSYTGRQSQPSWQIDIYQNGSTGEIVAKKIRDVITPIMENHFHMRRITARPVTNVADTTIYRYMLRYDCMIDEDRQAIYS
jgi:hypothetical protein